MSLETYVSWASSIRAYVNQHLSGTSLLQKQRAPNALQKNVWNPAGFIPLSIPRLLGQHFMGQFAGYDFTQLIMLFPRIDNRVS